MSGSDVWMNGVFERWLLRVTSRHSEPFFVYDSRLHGLIVSPYAKYFDAKTAANGWRRRLPAPHGVQEQKELCSAIWSSLQGEKLLDEALLEAGLFDALQRFTSAVPPICNKPQTTVVRPSDGGSCELAPAHKACSVEKTELNAPVVSTGKELPLVKAGSTALAPSRLVAEPRGAPRMARATRFADMDRKPVVQRSKRIVQVAGVLGPMGGVADDHMRDARTTILDWVAERDVSIPEKAFLGEPFERDLTQARNPIAVESTTDCWAMQFDTMPQTAGETVWRTEVVLLKARDRVQMGLGLTAIDSNGTDGIRHTSIPNVIRRLTERVGLFDDGRLLGSKPTLIETVGDIDELIDLIESSKRTRAVVTISADGSGSRLIPPARLARRLAGVAHVVDLDSEASWELSRRYGKPLSVFGLAVRVYRTSFDADIDSPTRHPLFVGERWLEREPFLLSRVLEICAEETTSGGHEAVPTFTTVRRYIAEQRLREASSAASTRQEQTVLLAQENERLRSECEISDELLSDAVAEREEALVLCETHKEVARKWRVRAEWLEARVSKLTLEAEGVDSPEERLPETWDDIGEWAEQNLGGRVSILPSALKTARKSVFTDIPLVYAALKMLADRYQPMRAARTIDSRDAYTAELQRLKLEVSEVGDATTNHRTEANYKAKWMGASIILNMHVSGSSSRLQQKGFRLYFYYDVENDIVVVGHFPTHLPNTMT